MSTNLMMISMIVISYLGCMFSNSWIMVWVMLEINTMSFCAVSFAMEEKETKEEKESIIKYLIIQAMASTLLIISAILSKEFSTMYKMFILIMTMSLLIKMGSSPFHNWFIKVVNKISWTRNMILLSWQKLIPVYLLIYQMKTLFLIPILMSMITGTLLMINKMKIKEIMAFSSIFNLSWMMMAISISTKMLMAFSILYWTTLVLTVNIMKKENIKKMDEISSPKMNKTLYLLMMTNLAGLPPMVGFLAKWTTMSMLIKKETKLLITTALIISAINLYVYMRIVNPWIMTNSPKKMKMSPMNHTMWKKFMYITNLMILTMMIL